MSATVQEFERAQKRVSRRYGLDIATRYVELRESALRVRVLECGEGRPLLFVSGDGAVAAAWAPLLGGPYGSNGATLSGLR